MLASAAHSSSPPPSSSSRPSASTSSHHEHPGPSHCSFNPQSSATVAYSASVGSRLAQGIEELRSALNRHSVAANSSSPSASSFPGPSRDRLRATVSAELAADGSRAKANIDSLTSWQSEIPVSNPAAAATATIADATSIIPMPDADNKTAPDERNGPDSNVTNAAPRVRSPGLAVENKAKRLQPAKPPVKVLPECYEFADPKDIVVLISSMLMELIHFNDKIPLHQGRLTRFHSRSPPRISVRDYLQRLTTHATLSPPLLLSMVYYIDRLCALYPAFTVSSLTIHRFLITSATVASKGLSDSFWTNKTYARVGGISVAELALLELEFLFRVEWRIVPQPEVLVDYYKSLVERCEGYEIQREGSGDGDTPVTALVSDAVDEAK